MPPKKLTKAEKDRLKREEAERKAREEEEQRQREEEERRLREEQEREEQEERERLKAIEDAQFAEEKNQIMQLMSVQSDCYEEWRIKRKEESEWSHYISCCKLPMVTDQKALNTYTSLYTERPPPSDIQDSLARVSDLYKLVNDIEVLQYYQEEVPSGAYDQLLSMIDKDIDNTTALVMKDSDQYIDSETFNLTVERHIPTLSFCLWGNVVKNPRLKDFTFETRDFTLDLPKPLLLADVAVRVLYIQYDRLSPLSPSSLPKPVELPQEEEKSSTEAQDPTNLEEIIKKDFKEREGSGRSRGSGKSGSSRKGRKGRSGKSSLAPSKAGSKVGSRAGSARSGVESVSGLVTTVNDATTKPVSQNSDDATAESDREEKAENGNDGGKELIDATVDVVDLRCYTPAGCPIILELLTLPPQPKTINNWTIKQELLEGIKPADHPLDPSGAPLPVMIAMGLPEKYIFSDIDSLQLARWDDDNLVWRKSGLKDVTFDLENRRVSFQTYHFCPLAIMSELYNNFPYQSWELLPLGANHHYLHVTGGAIDVAIEIKETQCTLVLPAEEPAVSDILNKPMDTPLLIKAMKAVGVNIFPREDSSRYTLLVPKHRELELDTYRYMSMACGGWGYQWSQWNNECGAKKVALRVAPVLQQQWAGLSKDKDPGQLSWSEVLVSRERSYKLRPNIDSFSDEPQEGSTAHSNLYTMVTNLNTSTQGIVSKTSIVHSDTVLQWLKATQPLSSA